METKQCAVCGIVVEVNTIYFKKRNAEYNLDHRGYDDDGSVDTLKKQIICCPMCGYCMLPEYFEKECFDRRIVTCKEYRRWQKADIPVIARHFACCAFILMYRKQYKDAAYSMLKALWVCESDKSCNKKALPVTFGNKQRLFYKNILSKTVKMPAAPMAIPLIAPSTSPSSTALEVPSA